MRCLIVVRHNARTQVMRLFDATGQQKFIGDITAVPLLNKINPGRLLVRLTHAEGEGECSVVGVVVPGVGAAFLDNHKSISHGGGWCRLEDACRRLGVEPPANVR